MSGTMKRLAEILAVSAVAFLAVSLLAGAALAQGPMGMGPGWMMGSRLNGSEAPSNGTGSGWGMMGGWNNSRALAGSTAKRLAPDQVEARVSDYLGNFSDSEDLVVLEIMEFEENFYAEIQEKSTGINAFELLIDPYSGNVWPEFGPNMMWNTKYGMMGGGMMGMMDGYDWNQESPVEPSADMPVKPEDAVKYAQQYLDSQDTSLTAEDHANRFYGYYTIHTLNDKGEVEGMLSINGYSGKVWYHSWHGQFIGMTEYEQTDSKI